MKEKYLLGFIRKRAPGSKKSISRVSLNSTATLYSLSSHKLEKPLYPNLLKAWFRESLISIHSYKNPTSGRSDLNLSCVFPKSAFWFRFSDQTGKLRFHWWVLSRRFEFHALIFPRLRRGFTGLPTCSGQDLQKFYCGRGEITLEEGEGRPRRWWGCHALSMSFFHWTKK